MTVFTWYQNLPKHHWVRRPLFRFGLPFALTVVGGSFWLRDFAQLRYTYRRQHMASIDEMEKFLGVPMKKEKQTPEQTLALMQRETEDDYKMVRGPRPEGGASGMAIIEEMKAKRQEERARKRAQTAAS